MKTISIKTTALPTGDRIIWENGMPQHKYFAMDGQLYNRWTAYVHNQVAKVNGFNKIKPGGVCHIEGQEAALRLAKEILR